MGGAYLRQEVGGAYLLSVWLDQWPDLADDQAAWSLS